MRERRMRTCHPSTRICTPRSARSLPHQVTSIGEDFTCVGLKMRVRHQVDSRPTRRSEERICSPRLCIVVYKL